MRNVFCMILTIGLSLFAGIAFAESKDALDGIAANVNETVITRSELNAAIERTKKQIAASPMPMPSEEVLQKQILDQLINRTLQLQVAEQLNIDASEEDIDKAVQMISQKNHMSVAAVYEKTAREGLSKAAYRKELREEIILEKVQQHEVGEKITISPQEVDDFMHSKEAASPQTKSYHLEEILISLPDEPTTKQITDAKAAANALLQRIHNGLDFHKAAMAESNGKNALQGGDLGWLKLPEVPTAFVNYVIHMQPNEVSPPIQTSNGFHILRLTEVRNLSNQNEALPNRRQVEELIFQRKIEEALQNWINRLRSSATIEIHINHPEG